MLYQGILTIAPENKDSITKGTTEYYFHATYMNVLVIT